MIMIPQYFKWQCVTVVEAPEPMEEGDRSDNEEDVAENYMLQQPHGQGGIIGQGGIAGHNMPPPMGNMLGKHISFGILSY